MHRRVAAVVFLKGRVSRLEFSGILMSGERGMSLRFTRVFCYYHACDISDVHCIVSIVQCTSCNAQCTMCNVRCTMWKVQCTMYMLVEEVSTFNSSGIPVLSDSLVYVS